MDLKPNANHSLKHVAIIMDGNGRWANHRNHRRVWGHVRGARVVNKIVEAADDFGVKTLTLFTFSTENWARPVDEIQTLFSLLKKFIVIERKRIMDNNVRFKVLGDYSKVPESTQVLIKKLEDDSSLNTGLELNFAFDYGGRSEITNAVNKFIVANPGKPIAEADLKKNLLLPDMPDVDLLIRTGGDQRISNFLLWQVAYAELSFTQTKWPDFTRAEFELILDNALSKERRFGTIESCDSLEHSSIQAIKNKELFESKKSSLENTLGHGH